MLLIACTGSGQGYFPVEKPTAFDLYSDGMEVRGTGSTQANRRQTDDDISREGGDGVGCGCLHSQILCMTEMARSGGSRHKCALRSSTLFDALLGGPHRPFRWQTIISKMTKKMAKVSSTTIRKMQEVQSIHRPKDA